MWGFGFRGFGFMVLGLGFRGLGVWGVLGFRVEGSGGGGEALGAKSDSC